VLLQSPYSLTWGYNVYVKIVSFNAFGTSVTSVEGFGAVLLTYPDAPMYLVETVTSRTTTSVSFSWSNGVSNGGAAIIDYRISYD